MVYNQFSPFKKKKKIILNYSQMSEKKNTQKQQFHPYFIKATFETARIHSGVILFTILKDIKSKNFLCIVH